MHMGYYVTMIFSLNLVARFVKQLHYLPQALHVLQNDEPKYQVYAMNYYINVAFLPHFSAIYLLSIYVTVMRFQYSNMCKLMYIVLCKYN